MTRPELVPENYQEIYNYFLNFEPSERIQNLGFAVMSGVYRNEMHYMHRADEIAHTHLEQGKSVIIAANHTSIANTPTMADIACQEPFFALRNNTTIPAKAEMFDWPLLGKFFPHMLAHPTFRGADFDKTEEGQLLRKEVGEALIQFNIDYIDAGGNVAIFPEGTRNTKEPTQVQQLRLGIARIALGVERPEDLLVIPAGFAYRHPRLRLGPVVALNMPFCPAGMTQDALLERVRTDIQQATDVAHTLAA